MTKSIAVLFFLSFFTASAFSYQQPSHDYYPRHGGAVFFGNYFKASVGMSSLRDYQDPSGQIQFKENSIVPIHLAYGSVLGNVAFEGELGFNLNDFDYLAQDAQNSFSGDIGSTSIMFNGYYRFRAKGSSLYLGGGLGFLSASMDGVEADLSGSSLAGQVVAGLELKANEKAGFFIEYKYLKSIGLELENDYAQIDFDYKQSGLSLGLKYYF